jgi:tetratricopeptide (TPR) repeat protein
MYRSLESRESQSFRRDTILFRIGECFLNMNDPAPAEARLTYVELRENFPDSEYVIDVDNRISELANRGERMLEMRRLLKEEAQRRLREVRRELSAMESTGIEDDLRAAHWLTQAAEALWDLERYEDARDAYVAAINLNLELRYDPRIQGRLIFPPEASGTPILSWLMGQQKSPEPLNPSTVIPRTPQGELRWPGGQPPLVIYNTTLRYDRAKEDPRVRYAIVTGQVKNVSNYVVNRATVEVTLTNIRDQVLAVSSSQKLPRLEPKGTAAFRVRLGPFDDYENIASYSARVLLSPGDIEQ